MEAAAWKVGDKLFVVENGQKYKCKISAINDDEQKIQVHYVRFNNRYDEWIESTSDRIVCDGDEIGVELDEETRAALGELVAIDEVTAKIVPSFSPDLNLADNERKLYKFPLSLIQECAKSFNIIKTTDEKIKKATLIKSIISKINSYLPSSCCICHESYRLKVSDVALFTCAGCYRGSHDCEEYKNFKKTLPNGLMRGFVWFCNDCEVAKIPDSKLTTRGTRDDKTTQAKTEHSNCPTDMGTQSIEATPKSIEPGTHPKATASDVPPICPDYKKSNCPHGLRGNKLIKGTRCKFSHPKPCQKYCGYGSKGEFGCKNGINCSNFHPRLCRYSLSKKLCINQSCKFVHLKGTARRAGQKKEDSSKSLLKKQPTNLKDIPAEPKKSKPDLAEMRGNKQKFLDYADRMDKRFEDLSETLTKDLSETLTKKILELHQNLQVQSPLHTPPYPPPTMMSWGNQQFHAVPVQTTRNSVVPHNPVPSSC